MNRRIDQLTPEMVAPGTLVRVMHVAPSEAERLGYVHDTDTLLGRVGKVTSLRPGPFAQLEIEWEKPGAGALMLAGADEIEVITWRCPNGCADPKPAWWPAPPGGKTPPCSNCDAPLEVVAS